jgi:hypothetical protein
MPKQRKYAAAERVLRRPYITDINIRKVKRQIQELHLLMLPPGQDYTKPMVQTSIVDKSTANLDKCLDRLKKHEQRLVELQTLYVEQVDQVNEILDILAKINATGALILSHYYIGHVSINDIFEELSYNREWTSRLKTRALRDLTKILKSYNIEVS